MIIINIIDYKVTETRSLEEKKEREWIIACSPCCGGGFTVRMLVIELSLLCGWYYSLQHYRMKANTFLRRMDKNVLKGFYLYALTLPKDSHFIIFSELRQRTMNNIVLFSRFGGKTYET